MKVYESKDIRNVALLGHSGSGKTILAEAMALKTKLIERMGRVEDKSTISDFDSEEQARGVSISATLIPVETSRTKINILDTPGYFDFAGEQYSALRVADAAVIVVDASGGVEVGTEKAWELVQERGIPAIVVINKLDRENVDFDKALASVQALIGTKAAAYNVPINAGPGFSQIAEVLTANSFSYQGNTSSAMDTPGSIDSEISPLREEMLETIASADEALMEKYLEEGELTQAEITKGMSKAVLAGELVPVLCAAVEKGIGVDKIASAIEDLLPSPLEGSECEPGKPVGLFVFKTIADPYVGKISLFKVVKGAAVSAMELLNIDKDKKEKVSHIYTMAGKRQIELERLNCGDLGALSKLSDTVTNNVLCDSKEKYDIAKISFPKPNIFLSITPKSKGDEDKLSSGLGRLREEDPTISIERNTETSQTLIYGVGEMQVEVIASKLKSKFGVDVELDIPIVPYRETIKKKATAEGKHKKQSGGSGQFGVVSIEFEPTFDLDVRLDFVDKVVGGTVPRQFIPAVEKGLARAIEHGTLAGYPIVGLRATLFDGKYHPVDSDEISFVTAANLAYKEGVPNASPVLLEPIYKIRVTVPERYMGDIMGDLNKKRGRIMGMEPIKGGKQQINAEVPLSEVFRYATDLRSMTQARGSFEMEFERYEEVPASASDKIIADAKAREKK
ncbi:MAG: elongation factor G [Eubacteriaceae bacterium]|jgi:elongation factor G|nr:elongation factor G [Eubacteriaceae bacterium]